MKRTLVEIYAQLGALLYYQSPEAQKSKGVSFESMEETKKSPFVSLAQSVLVSLEKMNLTVVEKSNVDPEQADALLRDRIEAAVKGFFDSIKVWKKGAIAQEELVARVMAVWKNL